MRGLEDEPDAIGHGQVFGTLPACPLELQHDWFVLACAGRFGEVREDGLEHLFADSVRDVPHRAPGGRFDEPPDVEPLITVMANGNGPFAFGCPYPSHDRLQADPVLVHRPELDRRLRMALFLFSGSILQFFLIPRDPLHWRFRDGVASVFELNIRWQRAHPSRADRART